jgi:hypothetical protein
LAPEGGIKKIERFMTARKFYESPVVPDFGFLKMSTTSWIKEAWLGILRGEGESEGRRGFYLNAIKKYALSSFGKGEL